MKTGEQCHSWPTCGLAPSRARLHTHVETYVAALAPVSAAQRHAFCTTARTSALQFTTDSLLGDCMAQKTDCREHSNVLVLCHRWHTFCWFLCLIPAAMCYIRLHLKLLAFESTEDLVHEVLSCQVGPWALCKSELLIVLQEHVCKDAVHCKIMSTGHGGCIQHPTYTIASD